MWGSVEGAGDNRRGFPCLSRLLPFFAGIGLIPTPKIPGPRGYFRQ